MNLEQKAVIRLIAGPADGFVFSVPVGEIPPFVVYGAALATYVREPGDGEVLRYRFTAARASFS